MLPTFRQTRSGHYQWHSQAKQEHLLPERVSTNDVALRNRGSGDFQNEARLQHSQFAVDVDIDVEYDLIDATGQVRSAGTSATSQNAGHPSCFEAQHVAFQNLEPDAASDQGVFEDSLLLEQRTHHKNVIRLGCLTLLTVLTVGGIMMTLDHGIPMSSSTTSSATGNSTTVLDFLVLAMVCCPPLWLICEGYTQKRQLDQEKRNTLANKSSRDHVPRHIPQPYVAPTPLDDHLPFNFPNVP